MRKNFIYIPVAIIIIIQFFDKKDEYLYLQLALLILTVIYAVVYLWIKKRH